MRNKEPPGSSPTIDVPGWLPHTFSSLYLTRLMDGGKEEQKLSGTVSSWTWSNTGWHKHLPNSNCGLCRGALLHAHYWFRLPNGKWGKARHIQAGNVKICWCIKGTLMQLSLNNRHIRSLLCSARVVCSSCKSNPEFCCLLSNSKQVLIVSWEDSVHSFSVPTGPLRVDA